MIRVIGGPVGQRWNGRGALALGMLFLGLAASAEDSANLPRFSLQATGTPLGAVVEQVSSATGYEVQVSRDWADEPVNVAVNDLPLTEGLGRILQAFNHYLVLDEAARTVKVGILGRCGGAAPPQAASPRLSAPARPPVAPAPPAARTGSQDGRGGAQVVYVGGQAPPAEVDAGRAEVVPPAADGTPAPTLEEVQSEDPRAPVPDPSQIELVPPGHE